MLLALGFVLAALMALLIGRGMWARALKALRQGEERERPSGLARLQADRDQPRAEYAILVRKFELRLDDIKTRLAEQTAEISRNRNRIERLLEDIDGRDAAVGNADADVAANRAQLERLEVRLAHHTASLQRFEEQLGDRHKIINGRHRELAGFPALNASHNGHIDALHATPGDLAATSADEEAASDPAYERLMAHGSSLAS